MTGTVVKVVVTLRTILRQNSRKYFRAFCEEKYPHKKSHAAQNALQHLSLWPTAKRVARFLANISCAKLLHAFGTRAYILYACFCDRYCADATAQHLRAFLIRDFCLDFPLFSEEKHETQEK